MNHKKNLGIVVLILVFVGQKVTGAECDQSTIVDLPEDVQREILRKVDSVRAIKKFEIASKKNKTLIEKMVQARQLDPQVLWSYAHQLKDLKPVRISFPDIVTSVAVSADKTVALVGLLNGTAQLVDLATGTVKIRLGGHTDSVSSVALSARKKIALTGSYDRTAKVWSLKTGEVIQNFDLDSHVTSVALSKDAKTAFTINHKKAKLWDIKTGEVIQTLDNGNAFARPNFAVGTLSPDTSLAIIGYWDRLAVWNAESGKLLKLLQLKGLVRCLALSRDKKIALVGRDSSIEVWNLKTYKRIRTLAGAYDDTTWSLALSADRKMVIAGYRKGITLLTDLTSGKLLTRLPWLEGPINAVALSPDKKMVLIAHKSDLAVWDLEKNK